LKKSLNIRRVSIRWILKESREKLKLVSQKALLMKDCHQVQLILVVGHWKSSSKKALLSHQVQLRCNCQFNFRTSCIQCTKIGGLPLILTFHVIMSTRVFESLSTCRWWKPYLQASFIPKYIPHIMTHRVSQVPIFRAYPLIHLTSEFRKSPPQPANPK
jgi:hypothetical protein